ncbi:MAG: DUF288 domain-containing protein [Magnetococcales bacterium]|nr:DUF288 domain-containing protein [Magnetococcales bacterium]
MEQKMALVITSINAPNEALRQLASGCQEQGIRMIVMGDRKSPADFQLDGCEFYGLEAQKRLDLETARLSPEGHYARKNIGYLLAIQGGADILIETDDDNLPYPSFWQARQRLVESRQVEEAGWVNGYRYFTDANIWPRGLPLDRIQHAPPARESLPSRMVDCPIQQGLADKNPDVDALYRLILTLPQSFRQDQPVAFSRGSWSPFNSQNTTWFRDAFPLLYLPAHCSFRMTDIWRGFVAQRLAWCSGWSLLFHAATMWQDRNEHNLMRDFEEEIPGYRHNDRIAQSLAQLDLPEGPENQLDNLRVVYDKLVTMGLVGSEEIVLLKAWQHDLRRLLA